MLLHDFLLHAERFNARRPAVVDGAISRDYAEVGARVRAAAVGLVQLGLLRGQHVAILAANGSFFFEAYFACSLAGLVAVPLNTRLARVELEFILEDASCRAVLIDDTCADLIDADGDRTLLRAGQAVGLRDVAWESLINNNAATGFDFPLADENDVAHICYTGGTTGRPKGVMLSHRNIAASCFNKIMLGAFARNDVWLHAAPMFHQADSWAVFSFTALGARHIFMPRFEPVAALDLIETQQVTSFQLVPTMIIMMLETSGIAERNMRSIRRILFGSAPMPVDTLRRCTDVFGDVFQHIYGLTEAAGTVAATPLPAAVQESSSERMASCGQPITGVGMRIAGDDGVELAADEIGRIQVRGANVMQGYWQRPAETAKAFVDGWLDTGDLGRMDRDGFLFIVDRAKDMISVAELRSGTCTRKSARAEVSVRQDRELCASRPVERTASGRNSHGQSSAIPRRAIANTRNANW